MTTAYARPRLLTCGGECAVAARFPEHHDRLLALDSDADVLLELFEIAVTWHELDYSGSGLIDPSDWLSFAETHRWRFPERAHRAMVLATDIARRHADGWARTFQLADAIELVRS